MTTKPDELFPGPCVSCGDKNYSLSFGGPTICPTCDCGGLIRPSELKNLRKILDEKEEKIIGLEKELTLSRSAVQKLREALEFFKNVNIVMGPSAINLTAIKALKETSDQERGK